MANLMINLSSATLVIFLMTATHPSPSKSVSTAQNNVSAVSGINTTDPRWRMLTGGRLASMYTFYKVSIIKKFTCTLLCTLEIKMAPLIIVIVITVILSPCSMW